MTIYVDELKDWGTKGLWCHMISNKDVDELHEFARRLGMQKRWFQGRDPRHPHYDLRPSKRRRALEYGAKSVSAERMVKTLWRLYGRPGERQAVTGRIDTKRRQASKGD